jgi:hypothetical protein
VTLHGINDIILGNKSEQYYVIYTHTHTHTRAQIIRVEIMRA